MIVDSFKHINIYRELSEDIYQGLLFLKSAKPEIKHGEYFINHRVKAIVNSYMTEGDYTKGFEAHKHVIDIQYPITGLERVIWSPIADMEIKIPYDEERDRTFYTNQSPQGTYVDIGNGIYAIMFPQDGHAPKQYIDHPRLIKKITVKVSLV